MDHKVFRNRFAEAGIEITPDEAQGFLNVERLAGPYLRKAMEKYGIDAVTNCINNLYDEQGDNVSIGDIMQRVQTLKELSPGQQAFEKIIIAEAQNIIDGCMNE